LLSFFKKRPYLLFIAPGFILYTILVIYPIAAAAVISLYRWNGIGPKTFVGFNNYIELFNNKDMVSQLWNALSHSLMIFILTVIFVIPVQIIMAYMVYSKVRGKSFFQVAIFSPQFISTPVIIFIFTLLLDANIGVVNKFLESIGQGHLTKPWLGIPEFGMYIVWIMISWAGMGVGMMFFVGAMKMVPVDCLESAYLDGAGFWKRLITIFLPQIKVTILNMVLISYIFGMTIFDFSYLLGGTSGGIERNVDVMSLFFYRMAFGDTNPLGGNISQNSMGMGTTIACVLFLMIFIIALIQLLIVYRKEE
jgi:raffinose/stachyose/melibiose transport system permease protein